MRRYTTLDNAVLAVFATAALAVLAAKGCTGAAAAQNAPLTPALVLVRLCISEAGWECFDRGDGIGIHEVLLRGSARQRIRYTSFARAYARRLFGARPHDVARLRWVGQITERCDAPAAWPTTMTVRRRGVVSVVPHAPWGAYRERCLAVVERAREVVTWTLDDVDEWGVCDTPVHDWGGWMDRARAARMGLIPVSCGATEQGTRNDFYCRPGAAQSEGGCVVVDRD